MMEQVYCMQNAFSPIVFSEESDEEQRLCGAAQSSRFSWGSQQVTQCCC